MTVALTYFSVTVVLQFVARRVFLERLGPDVLGLNTTALNILEILNLAELGVGVAVGYALYRPLASGDEAATAEIVALQGHIYRRIACVIACGAAVVSCFFPLIFAKMPLPLWYAYASFGVMLVGSLLSYRVSYRQIVLFADQRDYHVRLSHGTVMALKVALQIAVVAWAPYPYIGWVAVEAVGLAAAAWAVDRRARRIYPYLGCRVTLSAAELRAKYPDIAANTRRLFIHRLADVVLRQSSPLVIYACVSMAMVAWYGNYMMIITTATAVIASAFGSLSAATGKIVADGDPERIRRLFGEMTALRFFIAATGAWGAFTCLSPLINIWLGAKYELPQIVVLLMAAIFFINAFRPLIDSFKEAYGLFADVWAAGAEAALNLGLSLWLGFRYGLTGVLTGVLISMIVVVLGWKPWYICRRGARCSLWRCWATVLTASVGAAIAAAVTDRVLCMASFDPAAGIAALAAYAAAAIGLFAIVLYLIMYATLPGMRHLTNRLVSLCR